MHLKTVLFLKANHLVHPGMTSDDESADPPYDVRHASSITRWDVLSRAIEGEGPPASVEKMLRLLSLHEGRPYSPCRHPEGDIHGVTLGTAVFRAPAAAMTLFHGNPCRRFKRDYALSD